MIKTRNLFNTQKQVILSRSDKRDYAVFMEAITKNTEEKLDKEMNIRNGFTFINKNGKKIMSNNVYLYGEVNLNNPKDIKYLSKFKNAILNPFDCGNWYYTTFNYDTGEITYNENKQAFLGINFISDFIKWFKFKYCIIGKPERVIIYKYPINRLSD